MRACFPALRVQRVKEVVKDLTDQITYKEKRREGASNVHNYKECDILTEQLSALKAERREHEHEVTDLQRKQKKHLSINRNEMRELHPLQQSRPIPHLQAAVG